jgi:hypothetical protein
MDLAIPTHMNLGLILIIIETSLLITPPLVALGVAAIRKKSPDAFRKQIKTNSIIAIIFIISLIMKISFTYSLLNFISISIFYMAYCHIVFSLFYIKNLLIRYFLLISGLIPIVAMYIMATVGFLGLLLIINDYAAPPKNVEFLEDGLICQKTDWGAAMTDEGYTVHLYRRWKVLPFLQLEVFTNIIDETTDDPAPGPRSCQEALIAYKKR